MSDYQQLTKLGLTKIASECYEILYRDGHMTASQLAKTAQRPRTSTYHALKLLRELGFAESFKIPGWTTRYSAIRLDKALESLAIYQRRATQKLVDEQLERSIRMRA